MMLKMCSSNEQLVRCRKDMAYLQGSGSMDAEESILL
jgi:hypothetical protein